MKTKLASVFAALGVVLFVTAVSLRAHHAFSAEFDAKNLSVSQYYDDANWPRFASPDAFLKQVYDQVKPKP